MYSRKEIDNSAVFSDETRKFIRVYFFKPMSEMSLHYQCCACLVGIGSYNGTHDENIIIVRINILFLSVLQFSPGFVSQPMASLNLPPGGVGPICNCKVSKTKIELSFTKLVNKFKKTRIS